MQLNDLPIYLPSLEHAIDRHFPTVPPESLLVDVLALMSQIRGSCALTHLSEMLESSPLEQTRASCVLVVENSRLIGVFTERDAVRLTASGMNLREVKVAEVMMQQVITLTQSKPQNIFTALSLFRQHQIRHLPVLDEQGQLVGVITPESIRQILQPTNLLKMRLVGEVMTPKVVHAPLTTSILSLAQLMAKHQVSCVIIAEPDAQHRLLPLGIITERDIVQFQALELNLSQIQAAAVMSGPLFLLSPEDTLWTANRKMQQRHVRRLVVAGDQGELQGIVTQTSMLRVLDPREMYGVVELLQQSVCRLEAERVELLQDRNTELEQQVQERTASLQSQLERERLLGAIALRIRQSLDLDEILHTAVAEGCDLLQADRLLIYRFWPDGSGSGITEAVRTNSWPTTLGKTFSAEVFPQEYHQLYREGRIRAIEDVEKADDIAPCLVEFLQALCVKAKLVVPLVCNQELWGLLVAHQCTAPRQWQPLEIDLLQKLATQMAIAIQQAELYQQLHTELTERQQTEAVVTEWKNRYEAAIQASGQILYDWNTRTNDVTYGGNTQEILGYSTTEMSGGLAHWIELIHPDDQEAFKQESQRVIATKQPFQLEYHLRKKDGSYRLIRDDGHFFLDNTGEVVRMVGFITDITERKRAEEERDRFFTLSLDMLCIAGLDGYFKRLNPAWSKVLGYTNQELLAKPFIEFVHPEDRPSTLAEVQKLMAGLDTLRFENRYRCKDGSYKWLVWNATAFSEEQLTYAVAHDITQRKRAEAEIKQLNETLEQRVLERTALLEAANQELDSFSYSVSHDLRAPLRHISGFVSALQQELVAEEKMALDTASAANIGRSPLANPKVVHYLSVIQESSQKMGQLIDGLLTLSRVGRRQLVKYPVNLRHLVDTAIGLINPQTESNGEQPIEFTIGELPTVRGDGILLQQVLTNLIDNAIKFSRDRQPLQITIGALADGTIFVRDNGIGFPEEYTDQLFGAFQRLHSAKAFPGMGIGLAIAQRIVHRHGGKIWAESSPDQGACFYFKLPSVLSSKG